jgi:regulator of replication initiation timing
LRIGEEEEVGGEKDGWRGGRRRIRRRRLEKRKQDETREAEAEKEVEGFCPYRAVPHSTSVIKSSLLMLYKENFAVCYEIRTEHIKTMLSPRTILGF